MGAKSRYVLVKLASVISGTTRVWLRERAAKESAQLLYDPAIGQTVLFKEVDKIKSKNEVTPKTKKLYGIER